jgi:ribonucleoside-diphosphate reductase alpha chain
LSTTPCRRHIDSTGTIEGAPNLKPEHLTVFDCSFRPQNGVRSIHYMGHVRMMAAVQPFISGAISKTINMPEEATVEEIMEAYTESWRLGLKAVAIYRDNSKRVQPMSSGKGEKKAAAVPMTVEKIVEKVVFRPVRRKLEDERNSVTHKFSIGGHEGYITVGLYPDGTPGEVFIAMSKEGSTISGLMDSFATAISYCLQYGVPLKFLVYSGLHIPLARATLPRRRRNAAGGGGRDATNAPDRARSPASASLPGGRIGCAVVLGVRIDHDAEWKLLQVRELRGDKWV